MSTSTALLPDPAQHPDNANLPNVNEPETILGLTIAFLVCAMIEQLYTLDIFVLTSSVSRHLYIELAVMVPYQGPSLGVG
jgi:hypothetical protein